MDRRLGGAHEPRAHIDAVGAEGKRCHQASTVGEAAGGDHRDVDLGGRRGEQDQAGNVVLAGMACTFEAVDADAVDAKALSFDRVAHRGALVQHLDAVVVEHRQVRRWVGARGFDDLDARVDDHLPVLVIRRRVDGREDRQVHAERLVGQIAALGDLAGQIRGRRLRQRGDETQRTGIRHRRNKCRAATPLHTTLHHGMLDPERLGELRPYRHRGAILIAPSSRMTSPLSIGFSTMCTASAPYSSGSPRRAGWGTCLPSEACASSGSEPSSGVLNRPGAMVTTRIRSRDRSRAIGRVMPTTPPLEAEYAAWPTCPSKAATLARLTMAPRSPDSVGSLRAIAVPTRRTQSKVPIRLIATTFEKASRSAAAS